MVFIANLGSCIKLICPCSLIVCTFPNGYVMAMSNVNSFDADACSSRSKNPLKWLVTLVCVMVFSCNSFANAGELLSFKAVERCDAAGKVKPEYADDMLALSDLPPCLSGNEIPKAALASATELRAYAYDLGKCEFGARFDFYRDDLMPAKGAVVADKIRRQVEALLPANVWMEEASMCFEPHHALVWFDERKQPIASANICFTCSGFVLSLGQVGQPFEADAPVKSMSVEVDFGRLQQIFEGIGVPINLEQACSEVPSTDWSDSVNALCKLESIRKNLSKTEGSMRQNDESVYLNRCVQLPNRIQF